MEISLNTYSNKNQAFGKTLLDSAKLNKKTLNGTYKQVDAFVSKLTYGDEKDISLLNKIQENWRRKTSFSQSIIRNFEENANKNVYITELKNKCFNIKEKVCCMMLTTNPQKSSSRKSFHIDLLQSAPAIADKKSSPIKGAGELTVYEAVKTAKKEGYKEVILSSIKDGFYSKIGFNEIGKTHVFHLEENEYDSFLSRVERKYNIK